MQPEIHYAKNGSDNVAYITAGSGPIDIVVMPGWVSNVGLLFNNPLTSSFFERIASLGRLIVFDKRGTGMSDRPARMPTLEERMDDLRAVLDAAKSESAVVFGMSEGGSMSMLFAATHPEKTRALILFGAFAKRVWSEDYPWAPTPEQRAVFIERVENHWHEDMDLKVIAPSIANDPVQSKFFANYFRMCASPAAALELARMNTNIDVRDILCCINVPTLVMNRSGDRDANVEEGRWIASQIDGSTFLELPGDDHVVYAGDMDAVLDAVEEFVTGAKALHVDRVLSTVLIMDIVGSTRMASDLGDRKWRALLEGHNEIAARSVARFHGKLVKFTGDGILATFDGPGRAIKCGADISSLVGQLGIKVRGGIHTGEIELIGKDVGGISVHIASRITDEAGAGEILASQTVKDLTSGSGIAFEERGEKQLAGVTGAWQIYATHAN